MQKEIKKAIEGALRNPCGAFGELIKKYYAEAEGTERAVFIKSFFFEGRGYWQTMRALNRAGYYAEKTTFYRMKADIIIDIALRACYEHLISPYGVVTQQ